MPGIFRRFSGSTISNEEFPEHASLRMSSLWKFVAALALTNIMVITGTGVLFEGLGNPERLSSVLSSPSAILVLSQFNLASENTLATWYASMLLFVAGIFALLCYQHVRYTPRQGTWLKGGWLIISVFFMLLSLDEMGSLHENAGELSAFGVLGESTWESVLLLPLILVMIFMVSFAWVQLKGHKLTFSLMVAGALFFISIPLQEHFESLMWKEHSHDETWNRPVAYVLLEEGSELFGTLCFITSMLLFLPVSGDGVRKSMLTIQVTREDMVTALWLCIILNGIGYLLAFLLMDRFRTDEGVTINWFTAVLPLFIAIPQLARINGKKVIILIYSIVLSGFFGSNFYTLLYWDEIELMTLFVRGTMIGGLVIYIYLLSFSYRNARWRMQHITGGLLISTAFMMDDPFVTGFALAGMMVMLHAQVMYRVKGGM